MTTIRSLQSEQLRVLKWLALALLLHAGLLLLPVSPYGRGAEIARAVSVSLIRPAPRHLESAPAPAPLTEKVTQPQPPQQRASRPDTTVTSAQQAEIRQAPDPAPPDVEPDRAEAVKPAAPDLSAARLLELTRQREWSLPETSESRRLGVFTPRPPPENWRPDAGLGPSRFDGRSLPDDVEIIDRWVAQDGSHNVLVEMPGGELLCGRAEAWDPMRPLVENVMMFRSCGAGTRTFEWPEHYRRTHGPPPER